MPTDFVDDDLHRKLPRIPESTDASVSRLSRQREQITTHVADAVREIEELKRRQDQLEKDKRELEDLTRKQSEYQSGKKDIIEKLSRSLAMVEKDEMRVARMAEVLSVMKDKFKESLAEVSSIREETWGDSAFESELSKAMVILEDARAIYRKGLAKIEAAGWNVETSTAARGSIMSEPEGSVMSKANFASWLKMGIAFSLPLIVLLVVLFFALLYLGGWLRAIPPV
jgi:chromosome segregation ATPase